MDKKAFSSAMQFIRQNPKWILLTIVLMLAITFGERTLSTALQEADLVLIDYGMAVVRLVLQSILSTLLVYLWHKQRGTAAPFSAVDLLKLFITYLVLVFPLTLLLVLIVTIPLAVWLFLRMSFYINEYITGRSSGIFSCLGSSFRLTKNKAGKYFVYCLKYLLFYFVVEFVLTGLSVAQGITLPDAAGTVIDIFEIIFLSVFMPYRYLTQCGFYSQYLEQQDG